ncbi:molybdopterin binding oxidoreductase [Lichtheimia hyalospora FSU 10163]|nr:molybdopterin binding oxidoreductase [Lichtheimia hyalospora FSU 10163]
MGTKPMNDPNIMKQPFTIDPRDANTPDAFVPRDSSMIRLTGKHPFNAEAPLKSLEKAGYVTPNHLHFVRNHGPVPQLIWEEHRIDIIGLVNSPTTITMDDITSMQPITLPVTMVCAGNRRKEQNMVKQSIGFGWGASGASTACWTGVYLRDVINRFGGGLKDNAKYICFEGVDKTSKGGYGTSIAANRVMSDHYDIILAYKMNGELLPADHGFPIRVIIPGCIGGRSVKWLGCIEATDKESTNPFHNGDNKVFPTQVKSAEQATEEKWWPRPEYTLYDLNINSIISTPNHDERIMLHNLQETYTARGYAYTGGNRRITRVEISLDSGKTWLLATLHCPPSHQIAAAYGQLTGPSYYQASRYWSWTLWHVDLEVADLVRADEMVVRAWDESQNTQPENLTWNLMGMMNNCWFRVKLSLEREPSLAIRCEHPTLAGPQQGGWMAALVKKDDNTEAPDTTKPSALPTYTLAQVEMHQREDDCWIIVHDLVYDCTPFMKDHPGGASSILITAGTDTTEEFDAIHSSKAHNMLQDYLIGQLSPSSEEHSSTTSSLASSNAFSHPDTSNNSTITLSSLNDDHTPFLEPKKWKKMILDTKQSLSPSIRLFRFVFDGSNQPLGLPIGQHVYLKLLQEQTDRNQTQKPIMRAYTPSSSGPGYVEFIVKVYFPDHQQPGGAFTQLLDKLRVGETIDVKGPLGEYEYLGDGHYSLMRQPAQHVKHIGMIAGGTGITPMWQILDAIQHDHNPPKVSLIYCARHYEDLVLAKEIQELQRLLGTHIFHVRFVLSKPDNDWKHGRGRLTASEISKHLFPHGTSNDNDKTVLLCGSNTMIEHCCKPLIAQVMGDEFASKNIFVF